MSTAAPTAWPPCRLGGSKAAGLGLGSLLGGPTDEPQSDQPTTDGSPEQTQAFTQRPRLQQPVEQSKFLPQVSEHPQTSPAQFATICA